MSTAIELVNVSKKFRIYDRQINRLKELFSVRRRKYHSDFWALKDINMSITKGGTVGIVGINGSGKSSLLQIMSGILRPTTGNVVVSGSVSTLLELGSGFNPDFTGRENVLLNGAIMGIDHTKLKKRMDEIIRFADIGDFVDHPVRTYSAGMYLRLAFSIAANVDPDILLIDEVVSVGDIFFQHKCYHRLKELKERGLTIVIVSHDMSAIRNLCDSVVLLDGGNILDTGDAESVLNRYEAMIACREHAKEEDKPPTMYPVEYGRSEKWYGEGGCRIEEVNILDKYGKDTKVVVSGEKATVRLKIKFDVNIVDPVVGVQIRNRFGVIVLGSCHRLGKTTDRSSLSRGDCVEVDFEQFLPLAQGSYSVTAGVAKKDLNGYYFWQDTAKIFSVSSNKSIFGLVDLKPEKVSVKLVDRTADRKRFDYASEESERDRAL